MRWVSAAIVLVPAVSNDTGTVMVTGLLAAVLAFLAELAEVEPTIQVEKYWEPPP